MIDPQDPKVIRLAQAMSKAEGFGPTENLPTRINNPCDLEIGDVGYGTQAAKTIFANVKDGWNAAYHEAWLMLTGKSHFYNPSKTFLAVAVLYTGGDNAFSWSKIVSNDLGLRPANSLQDYLDA